jgi:hypothetical protein
MEGRRRKRHIADFAHAVFGQQPDLLEFVPKGVAIFREVDKRLNIHQQGSKRLRNLVVKLSRNSAAFILLCVDQPLGKCFQLGLVVHVLDIFFLGAALQLGDVDYGDRCKQQSNTHG